MAESNTKSLKTLQVTRAPGSDLRLDDVVKLMRVSNRPINWSGRTDAYTVVTAE